MRHPLPFMLRTAMLGLLAAGTLAAQNPYAPDKPEPGSVEAIAKYVTDPRFTNPWVAYVPDSELVPSPSDYLKHVVGAAGELSSVASIYGYFRELARTSPRVKVETIGKSDEGRDILLVIVSDVPESRMSVRSCAGHIATSVSRDFKIDPHRMLYIEYYPESIYGERQDHVIPEKYEAVDFEWTAGGAIHPRWRTLKPPLLDAIRRLAHGKHREDHGAPDGV